MEALACGTPVIAYRSGALPDIVEHGVTGFLVDNVEQMAAAIRNVRPDLAAGLPQRGRAAIRLGSDDRELSSNFIAPSCASANGTVPMRERLSWIRTAKNSKIVSATWADLWNDDGQATPFQSPAWLVPWCRCFRRGCANGMHSSG